MITETTIRPHTVAFMDFGTNSVRLLVVRIEPNLACTVLHQLKETVRLGDGEFARHLLQPQAIERTVAAARRFADVARAAGADEIVAVGTAATREADNRQAFLRKLAAEAGIELRIVSGKEEARLIYLGVASGVDLGTRQAFFIDIGGGSTETAVGTQDEAAYLNSLKLGAIRLTNQFLRGVEGPVSPDLYERIRTHVRNEASRTLTDLRAFDIDLAVGSSGTIENLADVCIRAFKDRSRQPDDVLTYADLRRGIRMLCSLPLEDRRSVPGINPIRADIIIGGAAILDVLMEELGLRELRISDRGLRDGLLRDYLARHGHSDVVSGMPLRSLSVLQLARACRFNEQHARQTAALALQLFDSARKAGLHALGEWERELLDHAALLHHIGSFLTYTSYQKHSHYLIRNADLLGFDELEVTLMALIVLNHRGSLQRRRNPELVALPVDSQKAVFVLSALLRLAENLDRGQAGNVSSAEFLTSGAGRIALELSPARDCQVEVSGLESQRDVFQRVFGRRLEIKVRHAEVIARGA
ncbi:MAG TPA: Ppx/GppA phosphatase family protein [Dehalococcoidia bacterium]|nr:Ppx/GppA phosphatase family protein [Dehalococcoidia bacterium]